MEKTSRELPNFHTWWPSKRTASIFKSDGFLDPKNKFYDIEYEVIAGLVIPWKFHPEASTALVEKIYVPKMYIASPRDSKHHSGNIAVLKVHYSWLA